MLASHPAETCCPQLAKPGASITRARHEARLLITHESLAAPASAFRLHRIKDIRGELLDLGGTELHAPVLAAVSGITSVAAAACTLGPALEARVSALFQSREPLLAMALDSLATEMLFRLSDQLYVRIRREARRRALQAGSPESPGDPGMSLEVQAAVLDLAGVDPAAISANSRGMLRPVKSLSFVVALGAHLPARSFLPRCVRCASREGCTVRPQ